MSLVHHIYGMPSERLCTVWRKQSSALAGFSPAVANIRGELIGVAVAGDNPRLVCMRVPAVFPVGDLEGADHPSESMMLLHPLPYSPGAQPAQRVPLGGEQAPKVITVAMGERQGNHYYLIALTIGGLEHLGDFLAAALGHTRRA
jgi:hypothetical protein